MGDLARVVHGDPEIMSGTPVFVGTRIPLRNLFDYLEGGYSLAEFLDGFPGVSREQAIAVLEAGYDELTDQVRAALSADVEDLPRPK